jgi:lysophospholipase L1-like esterase
MRSALQKLALLTASCVLVFAVLEIGFRTLELRGAYRHRTRPEAHDVYLPESQNLPGVERQYRPDVEFEMRYDSNPRGYFDEDNGLVYRINRDGFRGPSYTRTKPDGAFRIIILGDSFAFGEGVRLEDSFSYRLRERFFREPREQYIEVLNWSVGGWSTTDEIAYLEHEGAAHDPDLVIVAYVLNDANYAGGLDLWDNFRANFEARGLVRRSHFASFVYERFMRQTYGRRYIEYLVRSSLSEGELWSQSTDLLSQGARLADEMGARFAVVIFPFMFQLDDGYPLHGLHDIVRSHCEDEEIPVLDLFDAFEGRDYAELWVHPSDQHPNDVGHGIAADAIAAFLIDRQLIPGPKP